MMKVLAIDPSSTDLGWAVLDSQGDILIAYGLCHAGAELYEQRLPCIIQTLDQLLSMFTPDCVACERAIRFEGRRVAALEVTVTGIKRWAKRHKLSADFYSPAEWKHSVIGDAFATKEYVARIVLLLYQGQIEDDVSDHITDAIAIGLHRLGLERWEMMGLVRKR